MTTPKTETPREGMRRRKGDIYVQFRGEDGTVEMLVYRHMVTEKHRAALKAASDAWFNALKSEPL